MPWTLLGSGLPINLIYGLRHSFYAPAYQQAGIKGYTTFKFIEFLLRFLFHNSPFFVTGGTPVPLCKAKWFDFLNLPFIHITCNINSLSGDLKNSPLLIKTNFSYIILWNWFATHGRNGHLYLVANRYYQEHKIDYVWNREKKMRYLSYRPMNLIPKNGKQIGRRERRLRRVDKCYFCKAKVVQQQVTIDYR